MKKADIGSVPIVEDMENNKLIGIITDRDLALKVNGKGGKPHQQKLKR